MKHEHHHEEHRTHRETGGVNEAEMDLMDKPEARTNAKKIDDEAEEKKRGGRAKRKMGGGVRTHHVDHEGRLIHKRKGGEAKKEHEKRPERKRGGHVPHHHEEHVKHVGEVHGHEGKHHAGRKPRKAGGRASSDSNPFSSARHGEPAKGRKLEMEFE